MTTLLLTLVPNLETVLEAVQMACTHVSVCDRFLSYHYPWLILSIQDLRTNIMLVSIA
jgi:hypothetical protein